MENFNRAIQVILHHEGGFVNHPRDPGGITNLGITRRVYESWLESPVTEQDMRDLTPSDVYPIYRARYWHRVRGDELPTGLDLCVFDFAVNAGVSRSSRLLQEQVGVHADGIIGSQTLAAVNHHVKQHGVMNTVTEFQNRREQYYRSLSTFDVFGRGWLNRNNSVTQTAQEWINENK